MTKRFVFLLVLLLVLMGSTLTALAENTDIPTKGERISRENSFGHHVGRWNRIL